MYDKPLHEGKITEILKIKNQSYYNSVAKILLQRGADYSSLYDGEDFFTTHSYTHLMAVENYIFDMAGQEVLNALRPNELYLLICAIYLHDYGMAITGERKDHHLSSEQYVLKNPDLFCDPNCATLVGKIIRSHGEDDLDLIVNDTTAKMEQMPNLMSVRIGSLMALLRMGDLLDDSKYRAPKEIARGREVRGRSITHWDEHSWIDKIIFDKNKIFLFASPVGPYSSRVLQKKIIYLNEQLDVNRKYLEIIGIDYKSVEWDDSTLKKLSEYTKKIDSTKYLEPFVEFNKEAYLYLHGRDRDEEELINAILRARVEDNAAILIGPSRIGKTSLVRGRIEQAFKELGFRVQIYDYIGADIPSLSLEGEERQLIIIDQAERLFTGEINPEINIKLATIKEHMLENKILHVLFVVRKDCYAEFEGFLKKVGINYQLYFMSHVLGLDVIKRLLSDNGIDYSDDILYEINSCLSLKDQNDLTTLQIVVSSILKKDPNLLLDENRIIRSYGSISEMTFMLLHDFFDSIFMDLTSQDKELLIAACNTKKNGTIRVFTKGYDEEKKRLHDRNIITLLRDGSYEFVHDSLAEFFCEEKLDKKEKELLDLKTAIIEGSTTPDILQRIQQNRDSLVKINQFSESSIGKLIYFYATENNNEQMVFWISKYPTEETVIAVIRSVVGGLKGRLQLSSSSLSDYRRIYKECIMTCIKYLDKKAQKDFEVYLLEQWRENEQYLSFCVLDDLQLGIDFKNMGGMLTVSKKSDIHNALLIEPIFAPIFCDIYYLLSKHNVLDRMVKEGELARIWLERIRLIIQYGVEDCFFEKAYGNILFDESIYCRMVSILMILLNENNENNHFQISSGKVIYQDSQFVLENDNNGKYSLDSGNDKEKIFKFTFKEKLEIAFLKTDGHLKPMAFMKHLSDESFVLFRKKDIENTIRKYKVYFNKQHETVEFGEKIYKAFGKKIKDWETIKQKIEKNWNDEQYLFGKIPNLFPLFVPDTTPLYKLLAGLCYITYANIKKRERFNKAKVYLMKRDFSDDLFDLYDCFYIKLCRIDKGEEVSQLLIDPYHISGYDKKDNVPIEFSLLSINKVSKGESWNISHEVDYFHNGENAIAILIGNKHIQLIEKYKDAFAYAIFWDDKINQVSKAVDEWEYELNKLLKILKTNRFITDIFVVGNVNDCPNAVGYLISFCKTDETCKYVNLKYNKDELWESSIFLLEDASEILKKMRVHIVHVTGSEGKNVLNSELNKYYNLNQKNVIKNEVEEFKDNLAIIDSRIANYINGKIEKNSDVIIGENLDDVYLQMLAMLTVYGEHQIDSYKKNILELKGITLTVTDIDKCGYRMSYRRNEIETYYKSQWISEEGEIYKSVHAHQDLKVNQLDTIIAGIVDAIRNEKGSRKLMFSFYSPTASTVAKFEIPSLLQCSIFVRYSKEEVYLDSIFTWRTNECVLGLPMSLESSIRWLDEIVLSEVRNRLDGKSIKLGTYKYIGNNMHCFDNNITRSMIAKIVSSGSVCINQTNTIIK